MREFFAPLTVQLPADGSLTDDIMFNASERATKVAFSRPMPSGWSDVTSAQFLAEVRAVAKGLVAGGLRAGDRVALLSRTRYEWTLLDYAIWYAACVSVPVYDSASAEQVSWILQDSGSVALITESREQAARGVAETRDRQPLVSWCFEQGGIEQLKRAGESIADDELESRRSSVRADSLATVFYTSGTTGEPKGCALTHGHLMYELTAALIALDDLFTDENAATVLFLPLAHVFTRVVQLGAVRAGVRLSHAPEARNLTATLRELQPTFILAVPRVFEQLFNTASQKAAADGRSKLFDRAVSTAIAYSRALDEGGPGLLLRARHRGYDRTSYRLMREELGGHCKYAVSGGAPLGERLAHFYRGIGIPILEGYGLTETSGAVSVNRPGSVRLGTVGQPLPGTTVKVAEDGELLIRGPQVSDGYWNNNPAIGTSTADGWLRTGDVGEIDGEGFLRVTGRKQEVIVTAGGKTVAPSLLEERIRAHPLVSQCIVVGDGRPFLGALVTLDADAVDIWRKGDFGNSDASDRDDSTLRREVQSAVDAANAAVSHAESIRRFEIVPGDWTEESGHLTPGLKLRRRAVLRDFRHQVEDLYGR